MILKHELIPTTEKSHPFTRAELKSNMRAYGYAEDEYFVTGTANIYGADANEKPYVVYADQQYVNRVLVRRPVDSAKFSGNVVVEILNPSAHLDIDRFWVNADKFFMRNGDIYIGITGKSDVLDSFMMFDSERYAPLSWPNPDPKRKKPDPLPRMGLDDRFENGYLWDILTDYAKLLKSGNDMNPLRDYGKVWLYMAGWSQCTWFVNRYIVSFASLPEIKGLWDGFYAAGGSAEPGPINSYTLIPADHMAKPMVSAGAGVIGAEVPMIVVNTESENYRANWKGDSDQPGYLCRCYQFAGTSHDEKINIDDWYHHDPDFAQAGIPDFKYEGIEGEVNNYPYTCLFHASFKNLYRWVREGVPAPHAPMIEMKTIKYPDGSYGRINITDAFGNAKGGIRTAALDYPTARYFSGSHDKRNGQYSFVTGHCEPFSPALLKELYGDLARYRELVAENTDEQIARGVVLREDREELIEEIVQMAKERGLK